MSVVFRLPAWLSHGQGWMEQHLELLKAKGQTWLPQYRSCEKTDSFQFGAGGPVKATGITRLPCATDGKHYFIDSCELTAGIPMLGSLKLLKALGTVLDLQAETAYLSKLQVTVPLRRLENGHLALSLLDSEEDFPETDSWEVVSKELVLPPFARRQEKNRQKVLTFRLDQGEEAEALSTETPDVELQYNFNTDLCRRLGSSWAGAARRRSSLEGVEQHPGRWSEESLCQCGSCGVACCSKSSS